MSGGTVCKCEEAKKPMGERAWRVTARHCNNSAFNGYKRTPSDYSAVVCKRCRAGWRTKAGYVSKLSSGAP